MWSSSSERKQKPLEVQPSIPEEDEEDLSSSSSSSSSASSSAAAASEVAEIVVREAPEEAAVASSSSSSSSSEAFEVASSSVSGSDVEGEGVVVGASVPEVWAFIALASDRAQAKKKAKVLVPDTILFAEGAPVCWVFCDRRGRLRRKHRKRLNWPEIVVGILAKRHRRGHPEDPVAVLRWRASRPRVVSTLLTWRELRDLEERVPATAGPGLTSWSQLVALQPFAASGCGTASGVFLHRYVVEGFDVSGGLPSPNQTREMMTWPGALRRRDDATEPSSQLVRDPALHRAVARCAANAATRIRAGAGSTFGPGHFLAPGLRLRGLVAEVVFLEKKTKKVPVLAFVHDLTIVEKEEDWHLVPRPPAAPPREDIRVATRPEEARRRGWWRRHYQHHHEESHHHHHHHHHHHRGRRVRLATLGLLVS